MELLVLGDRPVEYLETVSSYLQQCGVYCGLTRAASGTFVIHIDDYLRPPFEIECVCEELDPLNVMRKTEKLGLVFQDVPNVISISSVKWFSEFQYNVDENWWGIDRWVSWDVYQKKVRSAFPSAKFGWVFSNAEKISMCNRFFQEEKNAAALHLSLQPLRSADVPALMERFLNEIGEEKFLKGLSGYDDTVGFMFSSSPDADTNCIGEKTNIYWTLYSFLQTSGAEGQDLYHSLFSTGEGTAF